jgi:hypothetical protein
VPVGDGVFDQPYPAVTHLRLGDELFLMSHERRRGRPMMGKYLGLGLTGAVLGELVLAGHVDVTPQRVTVITRPRPPRDSGDADPVVSYVIKTLADQTTPLTSAEWVTALARETCRRVGQRLAEAGVVTRERRWRQLWYPRTSTGWETSPEVRVGRYVLDGSTPPDVHTALLIALIHILGLHSCLALDLSNRQLQDRMEPVRHLLPPAMQAIVGAVDKAIWGRVTVPHR